MNIRKGDSVRVISGNERGKTGKVLHVFPESNRLIVEGVNIIKRHTRQTKRNVKGGIISKEAPIHRSNVKYYCTSCSAPTRIAIKRVETKEGSSSAKIRFCRKCGAEL